jgi:hypothetical protein
MGKLVTIRTSGDKLNRINCTTVINKGSKCNLFGYFPPFITLIFYECYSECCGSMTFCKGSGSEDPYK